MGTTTTFSSGHRHLRFLIAAFAAMLVAVSCSASGIGAGSGASASQSAVADATLKVALNKAINSIDPHGPNALEIPTNTATINIFDTLVERNGQSFTGSLATKWETPDPFTWIFTLRDGVSFSDGSPLTAEDVKASVERVIALKGPLASLFATVDKVEAPTKNTVQVHTQTPTGPLLSNLTLLAIGRASQFNDPSFARAPIGTGPFKVSEFVTGDHATLVRNDKYWGKAAGVQTLKLVSIPEASSRITALKTGETDLTWPLAADELKDLSSDGNISTGSVPSNLYYYMWFNNSRAPFTDVRVRQAMWNALDVSTMVNDLFKDTATVADSVTSPNTFGYAKKDPYKYDPALARSKLKDAGFPNGFSTTLDFNPGAASVTLVAQAMISYWKAVGINVELKQKEQAVWLKDFLDLKWDLNMGQTGATNFDADGDLGRLYPSSAKRLGLNNADLDKVLADAKASSDPATRLRLYKQATDILWDNAIAIFPIQLKSVYAWRKGTVDGVQLDPNYTPRLAGVRVLVRR